jgi:hypothetical protein
MGLWRQIGKYSSCSTRANELSSDSEETDGKKELRECIRQIAVICIAEILELINRGR